MRPQPQPGSQASNYKRSWRNLLINKSYQLKFTLMMVGVSTVLMVGLGVWVMKVANETTEVSIASVRGTPCVAIPSIGDNDLDEVPTDDPAGSPGTRAKPSPAPSPAPVPSPTPADAMGSAGSAGSATAADAGSDERHHGVVMEESTMELVPEPAPAIIVPPDYGHKVVSHWSCERAIAAKIDDLESGRRRILFVLIGTGLLLVLGLAAYGIKMTHKVAGPLFKVGLYLQKMRDGRFDKVWNLRKGDQLVDFYEHFKLAHAGVVQMQKDDIARMKAVIVAAETAGAGEHATVQELRDLIARKEKALE